MFSQNTPVGDISKKGKSAWAKLSKAEKSAILSERAKKAWATRRLNVQRKAFDEAYKEARKKGMRIEPPSGLYRNSGPAPFLLGQEDEENNQRYKKR